MQPRADICRKLFGMKTLGLRRCFLSCERVCCRSKNRDAGTQQMEKIAPRQFEFVNGIFAEFKALWFGNEFIRSIIHCPGSRETFAAFNTASMMRGCVPQRHILPCNPCTMSAGLGFGFAFSSPTLLMIIPEVQ